MQHLLIDHVWINHETRVVEHRLTDAIRFEDFEGPPTLLALEESYEKQDAEGAHAVKVIGIRPVSRSDYVIQRAANGLGVEPSEVKAAVLAML